MFNKPKFLWNSIGHEKIKEYLEYFIVKSKINHAYLFYGNSGIGKKEATLEYINNILCFENAKATNSEQNIFPCNTCEHCRQMRKNLHPDIIWINKEYNEKEKKYFKNINIEQIRDLTNKLHTAKFLGKYKIAVIEKAHTMSLSAFNSLLKILEEPPPNVVIILLCDTLSNIPKTIISRCQRIQFFPVPQKTLKNYLMQNNFEKKKAQDLASLVNGKSDFLKDIMGNPNILEEYLASLDSFFRIINAANHEKIDLINELSKSQTDSSKQSEYLQNLFNVWLVLLRDLILIKIQAYEFINHKIIYDKLISASQKIDIKGLCVLAFEIKKTKKLLDGNINQKLAMENILLTFE